ncbi:MAG: hypothetical protein ACTSR8_22050 [Promethearchaeota archaeon]
MKLRLVLKTKTKRGKEKLIKLSITPSKHLGFISFINKALSQDKDVILSLEKRSSSGEIETNLIEGYFKFKARSDDK